MGAYEDWLATQARQAAASSHFGSGFRLQKPDQTLDPSASIGTYSPKLTKPTLEFSKMQGTDPATSVSSPATDWSSLAVGGIGAAGSAASAIAQAATQKVINDQLVAGNALDRASSEKMAMARLLQNQGQFDTRRQMGAYDAILNALRNASRNTSQQRDLNRTNTRNNVNALQTAYLG